MNKLISVIMPVKNGEKYIEEAVKGIISQKMNVEIIVVDDASSDLSAEIAEKLGCSVIHHDICKGQVAGKNTGLRAATGEYILFHDADDVMREGSLQRLYTELEASPSFAAAMAKVQDYVSPDLPAEDAPDYLIKKEPYYGLFTGAVLIRRIVFDEIGSFDEKLNTGEIISWKSELDKRGMTIKKLDFISVNRRVHKSNYGKTNREKEFKDYLSVLRARMAGKSK